MQQNSKSSSTYASLRRIGASALIAGAALMNSGVAQAQDDCSQTIPGVRMSCFGGATASGVEDMLAKALSQTDPGKRVAALAAATGTAQKQLGASGVALYEQGFSALVDAVPTLPKGQQCLAVELEVDRLAKSRASQGSTAQQNDSARQAKATQLRSQLGC